LQYGIFPEAKLNLVISIRICTSFLENKKKGEEKKKKKKKKGIEA
jgi:hypothetical protein